MTKEWLWWGVQYNAWNTVKKNSQFGTEQKSTLKDDPPCGTPVECYAKAIEALKEAEEKASDINKPGALGSQRDNQASGR